MEDHVHFLEFIVSERLSEARANAARLAMLARLGENGRVQPSGGVGARIGRGLRHAARKAAASRGLMARVLRLRERAAQAHIGDPA